MEDYIKYQEYLGEVPAFLYKYMCLSFMKRLKKVSLFCGMDYASKSAYNFKFYVSRFDHSVNVALITWKLTNDKKATLAALFHDASTPVFSHVVDYMNGDYIKQESTEEKNGDILRGCYLLEEYLKTDGLTTDDVCNFKDYSIVDLERPMLCSDRLENIISVGMAWVGSLTFEDAKRILDDIYITSNENGESEIAFKSEDVALYVKKVNDIINEMTHSNVDNFMMQHAANMLKKCIELNIVNYNNLYYLNEDEMIDLIESNLHLSEELDNLWNIFKNIDKFPNIDMPEVKNKVLLPIVGNNRLK